MTEQELNNWIDSFVDDFDIFWIEDSGHCVIIEISFNNVDNESGSFIRFNSWDESDNITHHWLKDDYLKLKQKLK